MRSEGLWRRGGDEWRVAVLRRRRRSGACRRAPALSPRPCPSRPRPRVAPRRALRVVGRRVSLLRDHHPSTRVVTHIHCVIRCSRIRAARATAKCDAKPAKLGCEVRHEERPLLTISHPDENKQQVLLRRVYFDLISNYALLYCFSFEVEF